MSIYHLSSLFNKPVWYNLSTDAIIKLTDDKIEQLRAEQIEIDTKNKEVIDLLRVDLKTIKELTLKIYGKNSKEVKYVNKFYINNPFSSGDFKSRIDNTRENHKKELEKKDREKKIAESQNKYLTECIAYLINKGKNIGVDFTAENAIMTAEDIVEQEIIKSKIEDDVFYDFSGQNCDGYCAGWNGQDHRCECGNRRVNWVRGDGFSIHNPYIYGEAY